MQIRRLYNISEEQLSAKQANLYVGISINNKYFHDASILKDIISFWLEHTKDYFGILIVDSIQTYNNQALTWRNEDASLRKAKRDAEKVIELCESVIADLPAGRKEKIALTKRDYICNETYKSNLNLVYEEYNTNTVFKDYTAAFVLDSLGDVAARVNAKWKELLCKYLLAEIPEVLMWYEYGWVEYSLSIYPFDSLRKLAEDLRNKFPLLCEKMTWKACWIIEYK